jgi:hypothetical protein
MLAEQYPARSFARQSRSPDGGLAGLAWEDGNGRSRAFRTRTVGRSTLGSRREPVATGRMSVATRRLSAIAVHWGGSCPVRLATYPRTRRRRMDRLHRRQAGPVRDDRRDPPRRALHLEQRLHRENTRRTPVDVAAVFVASGATRDAPPGGSRPGRTRLCIGSKDRTPKAGPHVTSRPLCSSSATLAPGTNVSTRRHAKTPDPYGSGPGSGVPMSGREVRLGRRPPDRACLPSIQRTVSGSPVSMKVFRPDTM